MPDRRTQMTRSDSRHADFERLYASHHRDVLAYCARRTSRPDAWDAAAEVFVVAWRRLDEVPPSDEERAWLLGVAYRVLANQRRAERRRRRLGRRAAGVAGETVPSPDELLVRTEESQRVIDALARLRGPDREIIQMTLWEELTPAEIAEALGISRGAVDQRFYRAKRRLASELQRRRALGGSATQVTMEKGGSG
jgi:RNA polymerase sigma factor (sigma-70 family)